MATTTDVNFGDETIASRKSTLHSWDVISDIEIVNSNEEWPQPVLKKAVKDEKLKNDENENSIRKASIKRRDPVTIERANLLNVCKLVIKELIDSSLAHGRMLDDNHVPLQQFFVVLEHVFRHGIKPKKGILRDKRDFWPVLEHVEKQTPDAIDITTSVREMPNIKSLLGRARAWLRLALMQKKLADYFRILIDKRETILNEYYEPGAIMISEEAHVISGLLVGLNVIDCNLGIKDEDLDQPMGVIDFSLYLRDGNVSPRNTDEDDECKSSEKMAAILDQKNYLEELNRHLNATVTNLQQKVEMLQTTNALMKEDLAIAKNSVLQLQEENKRLMEHKETLLQDTHKQLLAAKEDLTIERETYQTSRAGLDEMYNLAKKRLHEETGNRLDVEKELELQISMKQEMEMAVRLLEKDIHDKQDIVNSLRKQMEDIKSINVDLYRKLQDAESSLKHKNDLVAKLEEKTRQMATTINNLESRLKKGDNDKSSAEETARRLGQTLADKEGKRLASFESGQDK